MASDYTVQMLLMTTCFCLNLHFPYAAARGQASIENNLRVGLREMRVKLGYLQWCAKPVC